MQTSGDTRFLVLGVGCAVVPLVDWPTKPAGGDESFPRSLINPNLACGMIEDILTTNKFDFYLQEISMNKYLLDADVFVSAGDLS